MVNVGDRVHSTRYEAVYLVDGIEVEQHDGFDHIVIRLRDTRTGETRLDLIDNIQPIR